MGVYDIGQDEGQAPEKIRDQGKKPEGHKHLSNMRRKETAK